MGGTNCKSKRFPTFYDNTDPNVLSKKCLSDYFVDRGYCSAQIYSTGAGGDYEKKICDKLTTKGEWEDVGPSETDCKYPSGDQFFRYTEMGCCHGICAISGGTIGNCKRKDWFGDSSICCLKDMEGCGNNDIRKGCFSDSDFTKTCHPNNRNNTSSECREVLKDICKGNVKYGVWQDYWVKGRSVDLPDGTSLQQPCAKAAARNLYGTTLGCDGNFTRAIPGSVDPQGLEWSQEVVSGMLERYVASYGSPISGINTAGLKTNNDVVDGMVFDICSKNPGLCSEFLNKECKNFTNDDLAQNPNIVKWCGCYLADSQYEKYINLLQINKECTPFCQKAQIPLVGDDGVSIVECLENICIIDDATINYAESTGAVEFNQICSSCGSGHVVDDAAESLQNLSKTKYSEKSVANKININPLEYGALGGILGESGVNTSFDIFPGGSDNQSVSMQQTLSSTARSASRQVVSNKCNCTMLDTTISIINSRIGRLNVGQNCGNSTCFKTIELGGQTQTVPYPCSLGDDSNISDSDVANSQKSLNESIRQSQAGLRLKQIVIHTVILALMLVVLGYFAFKFINFKFKQRKLKKSILKSANSAGSREYTGAI